MAGVPARAPEDHWMRRCEKKKLQTCLAARSVSLDPRKPTPGETNPVRAIKGKSVLRIRRLGRQGLSGRLQAPPALLSATSGRRYFPLHDRGIAASGIALPYACLPGYPGWVLHSVRSGMPITGVEPPTRGGFRAKPAYRGGVHTFMARLWMSSQVAPGVLQILRAGA